MSVWAESEPAVQNGFEGMFDRLCSLLSRQASKITCLPPQQTQLDT